MNKRYSDALYIVSSGLSDPSGIALSIIEACEKMRRAGLTRDQMLADPAVRLMVWQLAYICDATHVLNADYTACVDACGRAA